MNLIDFDCWLWLTIHSSCISTSNTAESKTNSDYLSSIKFWCLRPIFHQWISFVPSFKIPCNFFFSSKTLLQHLSSSSLTFSTNSGFMIFTSSLTLENLDFDYPSSHWNEVNDQKVDQNTKLHVVLIYSGKYQVFIPFFHKVMPDLLFSFFFFFFFFQILFVLMCVWCVFVCSDRSAQINNKLFVKFMHRIAQSNFSFFFFSFFFSLLAFKLNFFISFFYFSIYFFFSPTNQVHRRLPFDVLELPFYAFSIPNPSFLTIYPGLLFTNASSVSFFTFSLHTYVCLICKWAQKIRSVNPDMPLSSLFFFFFFSRRPPPKKSWRTLNN
jgi:hypothetical protein